MNEDNTLTPLSTTTNQLQVNKQNQLQKNFIFSPI